jgi:hypothetical protein
MGGGGFLVMVGGPRATGWWGRGYWNFNPVRPRVMLSDLTQSIFDGLIRLYISISNNKEVKFLTP